MIPFAPIWAGAEKTDMGPLKKVDLYVPLIPHKLLGVYVLAKEVSLTFRVALV